MPRSRSLAELIEQGNRAAGGGEVLGTPDLAASQGTVQGSTSTRSGGSGKGLEVVKTVVDSLKAAEAGKAAASQAGAEASKAALAGGATAAEAASAAVDAIKLLAL